jgi:hypothetical protein
MKGRKRGRDLKKDISSSPFSGEKFADLLCGPAHLRKLVADLRFANKKIFACRPLILSKLPLK